MADIHLRRHDLPTHRNGRHTSHQHPAKQSPRLPIRTAINTVIPPLMMRPPDPSKSAEVPEQGWGRPAWHGIT
jgi:hypothetical protein